MGHRRYVALGDSTTEGLEDPYAPWVMRRVRGRSSGDGRLPKRPRLERVV